MNLSRLAGRRIAIVVHMKTECRIFKGSARYEWEQPGGRVLRIEPEGLGKEDGHPVFVIREDDWEGEVRTSTQYGCDFQLELYAASE